MMVTAEEAKKIAERFIAGDSGEFVKTGKRLTISPEIGEVGNKYVFEVVYIEPEKWAGLIPPGGKNLTVDKKNGECKFEYLEREGGKPYAEIIGYRKLRS